MIKISKGTKVIRIFFLFVAFIILFYLLNRIGFTDIFANIKKIHASYLILVIFIQFFIFVLWNLQQNLFIHGIVNIKFFENFPILFAGVFGNILTPGVSSGGEPIKAYFLSKKYKKPGSRFLASGLFVQLLNIFMSLFLVLSAIIVAFFIFPVTNSIALFLEVIFLAVILIMGITYVFTKIGSLRKLSSSIITRLRFLFSEGKSFFKFKNYFLRHVKIFSKTFRALLERRQHIFSGLIVAFLVYLLIFLKKYTLFLAFEQPVSILAIFVISVFSIFLGSITPVPGGIGISESSMILLYFVYGIKPEIAASVVLLDSFVFYMFALGIGYLSLLWLSWKFK